MIDLQLFGGGGTTTTSSRNIPGQTATEANLENGLAKYATTGLNNSTGLLNAANNSLGGTTNVNWNNLLNNYNGTMSNSLSDYANSSKNNLSNYANSANSNLANYNTASNNALNSYNNTMSNVSNGYSSLANGQLPSSYATARQQALNSDLTSTVGNAINSLGNRGIVNSSVTNAALNDVTNDAANTLAKNYTSDLNTQSNLLGQQANNASNQYNSNLSNAQNQFTNASNTASNLYNNQSGAASNLYNNQTNNAASTLAGNSAAQQSSYYTPSQLLSYANSEYSPASNLYNTMYSGRMGTSGITQTSNDGGAGTWNAVGQLGSAAILCFVAGTKISTPDGDKNIEEIELGDKVYSLNGKIEKVIEVQEPQISPNDYMIVRTKKAEVRPTSTQPFLTTDGYFLPCKLSCKKLIGIKGNEEVISVEQVPVKELVYDFKTTGENVYFANGFAVRGRY